MTYLVLHRETQERTVTNLSNVYPIELNQSFCHFVGYNQV